jgi:hypothetical protein
MGERHRGILNIQEIVAALLGVLSGEFAPRTRYWQGAIPFTTLALGEGKVLLLRVLRHPTPDNHQPLRYMINQTNWLRLKLAVR